MFREILSILRREDLLKQAMQEAQEMLSKAELMFRASVCRLMEFEETDIDIYKEDREVNRMEWEIRQKGRNDVCGRITDSIRHLSEFRGDPHGHEHGHQDRSKHSPLGRGRAHQEVQDRRQKDDPQNRDEGR